MIKFISTQKIVLPILAVIGLVLSCDQPTEQKTTLDISGIIKGSVGSHTIAITEINEDIDDVSVDTLSVAKLNDGKFEFTSLKIDKPRAAKLTFGNDINAVFFLEPGELTIQIFPSDTVYMEMFEGTEVRANRKGTPNNDLFTEYRNEKQNIISKTEFKDLRKYDANSYSIDINFEMLNEGFKKFGNLFDQRDEQIYNLKEQFIKQHSDKMLAPYIVIYEDTRFDDVYSPQEIIACFDGLDTKLTGNKYYDYMSSYVEDSRNTAVGVSLKDFELSDRNGKKVSLSSYKGKVVLIDLWAYWCKPCIASFPHLEELLNRYKKQGFDVLGVSNDPNLEKWIKALDKYQPSWTQVIDSKDKKVSKQFNISKLPTTFLVDREGKVLAKDLSDEDLEYELNVLFNN